MPRLIFLALALEGFWMSMVGSLATQGYGRMNAGSAQSGKISGKNGDGDQKEGHHEEGGRVIGLGAEKQRRHDLRAEDRGENTDGDAERGKLQGIGQNAALDDGGRGAKSHADAELLSLTGHGVGDHAVDAEGGKEQAERGEGGDEKHEEAAGRNRAVHDGLDGTELGGGLLGIQIAQGAENGLSQGRGGQGGADDELRAVWPLLGDRVIDLRAGAAFDVFFVDVVHDADDPDFCVAAAREKFADSVFVRPIGFGGGGINKDHLFGVGSIGPGEVAATQANAHGADETGSDDVHERIREFAGLKRFAFGCGSVPFAIGAEREIVGHAGGFDAGEGADASEDLLENYAALDLAGFVGGSAVVVIDFDGCGVLGLKAEVHIEDVEEAAEEQAGADEQHAGQGDFGNDEGGAEAFVFTALARAGAGILESVLKVAAGHAESGEETEDHSSEDGDKSGPGKGLRIQVQAGEERESDGTLMRKPEKQKNGEGESDGRACAGENQAFHEQLADDAGAVSAKSATQGEFFGAGGGASEEQVGEIDAGDEEDGANRSPERNQGAA